MAGSKKLRGKTCVYCGKRPAETVDHILSRKIFHTTAAENVRQVPACAKCNTEKSKLENYAGSVLLFASNHPEAVARIETLGVRRLAKNKKLAKEMGASMRDNWRFNPTIGMYEQAATFKFDERKLCDLSAMIARGLLWYEAGVSLPDQNTVEAAWLNEKTERRFDDALKPGDDRQVVFLLNSGLFQCHGRISVKAPGLSIWRFNLFGGVKVGRDTTTAADAQRIGVLTRAKAVAAGEKQDVG